MHEHSPRKCPGTGEDNAMAAASFLSLSIKIQSTDMMVKENTTGRAVGWAPATKVYTAAHCRTPVNPCIKRAWGQLEVIGASILHRRHAVPQRENLPSYLLSPELGPCCFPSVGRCRAWPGLAS